MQAKSSPPEHRPDAHLLKALPSAATRQFDLCVLTPIASSCLPELRSILERIRNETIRTMQGETISTPLLPWQILGNLHFGRFVIIEAHARFDSGPLLALSTNYDAPPGQESGRKLAQKRHIAQLVEFAGNALDSIYRCCEGYSGLNNLAEYMAAHHQKAATFYVGTTGRCLKQVLGESDLRTQVQSLLDKLYRSEPKLLPEEVRDRVRNDPSILALNVPGFPAQPNRIRWVVLAALGLVAALVGLIWGLFSGLPALQAAAALLLATLAGAVWAFRHAEKTDPQFDPKNSNEQREHLQLVAQDENLFLHNELSHLVDLKRGILRRIVISIVYLALQLLARNFYNHGKLGNIPSIHFARWCRIDRGRRVLFMSNFDNSWESYLGDFIDQASLGLTGVWSNTEGYPRTVWLLNAGSRAASRFKAWTRKHQIRTQVWYSAYPNLSVRNVNANTEIRRGLAEPSSMSARIWLDWLQGIDRRAADKQHTQERKKGTLNPSSTRASHVFPATGKSLDQADVQGLILHGYGGKKGVEFLMLRVSPGRGETARQWFGGLELMDGVRGHRKLNRSGVFMNLAFTHEGLQALQLDTELLNDFPVEFVQGAAHDIRCRVNGDTGSNGPDHWKWGAEDRSVHALVLVYADNPADANQHAQHLLQQASAVGLQLVEELKGGELPGRKEHFGFRDGISQPVLQGVGKKEHVGNTLPVGEFLLGHANAYHDISYAPTSSHRPSFGKNGSYLVFRQLSQDVPAFWHYCQEQAEALHMDAVTVASKIVGRWPSGASLVKHPHSDPQGESFQNEDRFSYLAQSSNNDRGGAACPFGSHLRRTNPRDWETGASRSESLKLASRHRIVRRGRPYGDAATPSMSPEKLLACADSSALPAERGLQFLAFGANIQRQFEFVQQQWSQNAGFAGLANSADGVNAGFQAKDMASFTIQANTSQSSFGRCVGLTQFVSVLGSAYFFMPSLSAVRSLKTD